MTIPAIRNYELRPPTGGWGIEYTFKGQKFQLTGGWRQVIRKMVHLHRKNDSPLTEEDAFKIANDIWCARDPGRCMTPAQRSVAQKTAKQACATCGSRRRARR